MRKRMSKVHDRRSKTRDHGSKTHATLLPPSKLCPRAFIQERRMHTPKARASCAIQELTIRATLSEHISARASEYQSARVRARSHKKNEMLARCARFDQNSRQAGFTRIRPTLQVWRPSSRFARPAHGPRKRPMSRNSNLTVEI